MRVNLLPPEVRRARRDARVLRRIRFAGLAALLLLGGVFGIRTAEAFFLRSDLDDLRAQQAGVQAQIEELADIAATSDAVTAGAALESQLLAGEISWSEQLLTLAQAIPPGFTLNTFSGSSLRADPAGLVGSVTFSASSRELEPTRAWLTKIEVQEGWANGWVSSAAGQEGTFTVAGSYDLTPAALSSRGGSPA